MRDCVVIFFFLFFKFQLQFFFCCNWQAIGCHMVGCTSYIFERQMLIKLNQMCRICSDLQCFGKRKPRETHVFRLDLFVWLTLSAHRVAILNSAQTNPKWEIYHFWYYQIKCKCCDCAIQSRAVNHCWQWLKCKREWIWSEDSAIFGNLI